VPVTGEAMGARDSGHLRREVLALVGWVIAVDAAFIVGYYVLGVAGGPGGTKVGYTAVWTIATLAVVLRGLMRVRAERLRGRHRVPCR
jgi:hypothetical protein